MTIDRVVVVGGGVAGVTAAESLRALGYAGSITVLEAEPLPPYDRPPLSKTALVTGDPVHLRPADVWSRLAIDLRLGVAADGVDLQMHEVLTAGGRVGYDRLLLATGGCARWPGSLQRLPGVLTLRTAADAADLSARLVAGARLVVVGGGLIGSEVAATARGLGVDVALVDAVELPLAASLGAEIAGTLLERHRTKGVRVRTGVGVRGVIGAEAVTGVELDDGSTVAADVVLVAVGGAAASAWLEPSGLELADPAPHGGIRCDRTLCAAPDVYVAGDLAVPDGLSRSEHWMAAVEQAEVAAANLLAGPGGAREWVPQPYFWTDQYDVKVQAVGAPATGEDPALAESSPDGRRQLRVWTDQQHRAIGAVTVNWPARAMAWRNRVRDSEPVEVEVEVEIAASA